MLRRFFFLFPLLLWASATASAQTVSSGSADAALRPGDQVRITVWGMPELSGEFDVTADGTLEHPLYREIAVMGVPVDVAEERVGSFLSGRDATTRFVMTPLLRIAVGGEVSRPDIYYHPTHVTIAQAITLAGGASQQGSLERVRLVRDGNVSRLDLTDPASSAVTMPIRSGDEIVVSRQRSVMRDYITPVTSVIGAMSTVILLLIRGDVL